MGNIKSSLLKADPLMTNECFEAREKIKASRAKYVAKLREESERGIDGSSEDLLFADLQDDQDSHIDSTKYIYPFENIVFEGGGVKGITYCGVGRALEEHGILTQIRRFGGASMGAIAASLYSIGCNSYDTEKVMCVNITDLVKDATCGYCSLLPNLFSNYGWNPGNKFLNYLGAVYAAKTGNPDITFAEVYKRYGNELCVIVTNVNTSSEEYCHVKTTPDMPIRIAVRMSMSIPGVFQVMKHSMFSEENIYIDGGILCNYPIHCFDGWWLSLDPQDSHLRKIQPIKDIHHLMANDNRFKQIQGPIKTIGCMVYSAKEQDYFKSTLLSKSGEPREPLPKTKIARKWKKAQRGQTTTCKEYEHISDAAFAFLKVLDEFNTDGNDTISKEEFENAFAKKNFDQKHSNMLFGEDCNPNLAFEAVDRDGNGEITYNEIMNFIEVAGVNIQEKYLGYERTEVTGFFNFLSTIFNALVTNETRIFLRGSDVNRTIGIDTWYIDTKDFNIEAGDRDFLIGQGYRSTVKYLQNFLSENELPKASNDDIKNREVPNKTRFTDQELEELLII